MGPTPYLTHGFPIPSSTENQAGFPTLSARFDSKTECSPALLPATRKKRPERAPIVRVAGLGIEPKFSLSESDVLPLDDPAIFDYLTHWENECNPSNFSAKNLETKFFPPAR